MNGGNEKKMGNRRKPKHPQLFFAGNSADVAAKKIYCICI